MKINPLNSFLFTISHAAYFDTPSLSQTVIDNLSQYTQLIPEIKKIRSVKEHLVRGKISSAYKLLQELHQMPSLQFTPFQKVEKDDVMAFINYESALVYRIVNDTVSYQNFLKIAKLLAVSAEIDLIIDYQIATIQAENNLDIKTLLQFTEIFKKEELPVLEIMAYSRIGEIQAGANQFELAHQTFKKAKSIIQNIESKNLEITIDSSIGYLYYLEEKYDDALNLFLNIRDCDDYFQKSLIYENTALIYEAIGEYNTALNYWMDSLNWCQDHGVIANIPEDTLRIGQIHEKHFGSLSQAKFFYKLGYDYSMEMFRDGINITYFMKSVIEKYISYFAENYIPEEKTAKHLHTNPFTFALGKTWKEIVNIFQYNLIVFHKFHSSSIANTLDRLQIKRSNFQAKQQKLANLGFYIPDFRKNTENMDETNVLDSLQNFMEKNQQLNWKDINDLFEKEVIEYLIGKYGKRKDVLIHKLDISYPNLKNKLRHIMN